MGTTNFTQCGNTYMQNITLIQRYNYTGRVRLIPANPFTQITTKGCVALCGSGSEYAPWSQIATSITTWVLPIIGVLLQAPFESNNFWKTIKAINRWIGSPISSFSFILWNIDISGRCALFVDMALPYGEIADEESEFASVRDSFYILMNLNQYKMKPPISMTREAEGLLRIMLFSKDLKLIGTNKTLSQMRRKLAYDLRSNRRRGVVAVFISTLWFLVALGISVESAFGELGNNAQAHDLALGLFTAWFPVLILCSILDRNPIASDDIQRKLNKMVDFTCISLQDETTRDSYISSFRNLPHSQQMAYWVNKITHKAGFIQGNFFNGFAGQARTRFHYGAAHAILCDIEKAYIAGHGRNWLGHDSRDARAAVVLGQVDRGFVWFDGRQMWQAVAAITLVVGTSVGGFILSFNTPTVGLGCRTGGYMIYIVIALALHGAEMLVWWLTSPLRKKEQFQASMEQYTQRQPSETTISGPTRIRLPGLATSKTALAKILIVLEGLSVRLVLIILRAAPMRRRKVRMERIEFAIRRHFEKLRNLTTREWTQRVFFTPVEFVNTVWMCYMIMAQTVGAFNTCSCMTSSWGGYGGYLDFTQWSHADSPLVAEYWIQGTIITCTFMALGMAYIVLEWLLQAHLSTENYKDAMEGLKRVRRFRRYTHWIRYPSAVIVILINNLLSACKLRSTGKRNVLVWSKETRYKPRLAQSIVRLTTDAQHMPFREALSNSEVSSPVTTSRKSLQGNKDSLNRCSCVRLGSEVTQIEHGVDSQTQECQSRSRGVWDEEKGEFKAASTSK